MELHPALRIKDVDLAKIREKEKKI